MSAFYLAASEMWRATVNVDTNGFELGDTVKDSVTGLTGVVTGIHQYLTGCARVSIQPPVGSDGKVPESYGTDVLGIEMVIAGPRHEKAVPAPRVGGPRNDPVQSFHRP